MEAIQLIEPAHKSSTETLQAFQWPQKPESTPGSSDATGSTNRCRYKHVAEADTLASQFIDMGGLNHRVTGTAHLIPALIVGQEEYDIRLLSTQQGHRYRTREGQQGKKNEKGKTSSR